MFVKNLFFSLVILVLVSACAGSEGPMSELQGSAETQAPLSEYDARSTIVAEQGGTLVALSRESGSTLGEPPGISEGVQDPSQVIMAEAENYFRGLAMSPQTRNAAIDQTMAGIQLANGLIPLITQVNQFRIYMVDLSNSEFFAEEQLSLADDAVQEAKARGELIAVCIGDGHTLQCPAFVTALSQPVLGISVDKFPYRQEEMVPPASSLVQNSPDNWAIRIKSGVEDIPDWGADIVLVTAPQPDQVGQYDQIQNGFRILRVGGEEWIFICPGDEVHFQMRDRIVATFEDMGLNGQYQYEKLDLPRDQVLSWGIISNFFKPQSQLYDDDDPVWDLDWETIPVLKIVKR